MDGHKMKINQQNQEMDQKGSRRRHSAQAKVRSTINNSTSKAQYTFSKSQRFPNRNYSSTTNITFYDVPIKKYDKNISFGSSKRANLAKADQNPPPNKYDLPSAMNNSAIGFKASRQECRHNSPFQPDQNPGPGQYNPKDQIKFKTVQYSLGKRHQHHEIKGKEVPGPKYAIQSTMLDMNKHLSIYIRRNSTKICPARTCFARKVPTKTEPSLTAAQSQNQFVTVKGKRNLGCNNPSVFITRSKRDSCQRRNDVPGPGHYKSFSEFVEDDSVVC